MAACANVRIRSCCCVGGAGRVAITTNRHLSFSSERDIAIAVIAERGGDLRREPARREHEQRDEQRAQQVDDRARLRGHDYH